MSIRASHLLFGLVLTVAASANYVATESKGSRYDDKTYGFSITPPSFEKHPDLQAANIATFTAPPSAAFASNLSIQRQQLVGSLEDWTQSSIAQFDQAGVKYEAPVSGQRGKHKSVEMTYSAAFSGNQLKFHMLALENGTEAFMVTCTALEKEYDSVKKAFDDALGSFHLDEGASAGH